MLYSAIRCRFESSVPFDEAQDTLRLARLAAASLVGEDRVTIEAPFAVDPDARTIAIGTSTQAGRLTALIFAGLARREFGNTEVLAEHVYTLTLTPPEGVQA